MVERKIARILCIDGGGIRGLIPAVVLSQWESDLGAPIARHFHMLAGTSTGGILCCGLARPPRPLTADELVSFYETSGPRIFHTSAMHAMTSLCGTMQEKYPASALEVELRRALSGYLSELTDLDLLVPAYAIEQTDPFFFKSWRARGLLLDGSEPAATYDFSLPDVARATSAAPTYFEPARVHNRQGDAYALVDGGVFANNPAMCAFASARQLYPLADEYLIVSLGTGQLERAIPYDDAKHWGLLSWARPILNVIFDGVSDTVDYQLDQLAPQVNHVRLQISLQSDRDRSLCASDDLDDSSPENMARLKALARELVRRESVRMQRVLEALARPLTSRADLGYAPDAPREPNA